MDIVVFMLDLIAGIALLGFLAILPIGIVAVFVSSWRDHVLKRAKPKAMELNGRLYGVLMLLFTITSFSGCVSMALKAIP